MQWKKYKAHSVAPPPCKTPVHHKMPDKYWIMDPNHGLWRACTPVTGPSSSLKELPHIHGASDSLEYDGQPTCNWRKRQEKMIGWKQARCVVVKLDRGERREMWQGRVSEDELVGVERKDQIIQWTESRKEQTSCKVGGRVTRTE